MSRGQHFTVFLLILHSSLFKFLFLYISKNFIYEYFIYIILLPLLFPNPPISLPFLKFIASYSLIIVIIRTHLCPYKYSMLRSSSVAHMCLGWLLWIGYFVRKLVPEED